MKHPRESELVVAVICFAPSEIFLSLLRKLEAQVESNASILVLLSGGPDCCNWQQLIVAIMPAVQVCITPEPLSIGFARRYVVRNTFAKWVAFLDGDCIPCDRWFSTLLLELRRIPAPALDFGPRDPDLGTGLGALVRRLDGLKSRKHLFNGPKSVLVSPSTLPLMCAGGNMAVSREVAAHIGIFHEEYEGLSFEDVDFQLRCHSKGYIVSFSPLMRVVHIHPLSGLDVLQKAISSARGLSLCISIHGTVVCRISRIGSPARIISQALLTYGFLPMILVITCLQTSFIWHIVVFGWAFMAWMVSMPITRPSPSLIIAWFLLGIRNILFVSVFIASRLIAILNAGKTCRTSPDA